MKSLNRIFFIIQIVWVFIYFLPGIEWQLNVFIPLFDYLLKNKCTGILMNNIWIDIFSAGTGFFYADYLVDHP